MIWKALFSLLGLASLAYILQGYGFARLAGDISGLGWWSLPLALSFFPVVFCYALAWLLITPGWSLARLPTLVSYSVISVAWNNLSPFVKFLGEPVRLILLERHMPRLEAARSVVLYNLVHTMGTLFSFFLGAVLLLTLFELSPGLRSGLIVLLFAAPLLGFGLLLLPRLRHLFGSRRRPRGRLLVVAFWLRWALRKCEAFSRRHPARFWAAVGLEVAARFVEGATFYVGFLALGTVVPALTCALLDVGRALVDNVFFFVPYQVGSREGGLLLLAEHAVQVNKEAAVSAAVFYRLVEILWMGIGYMLWIRLGSSRKLSR